MLVAVPEAMVEICTSALAPLRILKVAHARAACDRMLATWPYVVVLGDVTKETEIDLVRATAADISAQVVALSERRDEARLRVELIGAMRAADAIRGSGGKVPPRAPST